MGVAAIARLQHQSLCSSKTEVNTPIPFDSGSESWRIMETVSRTLLIQILRNLPFAAKKVGDSRDVAFVRYVICQNQGRLAVHYFLANRKHKRLKDKLLELKDKGGPPTQDDLDELKACHSDLGDYLFNSFSEACSENFKYFKSMFTYKCKKNKLPRICVKSVIRDKVITLAKDLYSDAVEEESPASSNTAFEFIKGTGNPYICNDIPKAIKRSEYENYRIYGDAVKRFYRVPGPVGNFRLRHREKEDVEWQQCWKRVRTPNGSDEMPDISTCYKSTLVIPMTLVSSNNSLPSEFTDYFKIKYNSTKTSIGFLCLDHRNINFFDEREDVDLGYIFADLLSLYLIQNLTCTDYSNIYKESTSFLHAYGSLE
jgi:hypothetical protein